MTDEFASPSMEFRKIVIDKLIRNLKTMRAKAKDDININEYNRLCTTIIELQDLGSAKIVSIMEVLIDNSFVRNMDEAKILMFDIMAWD